MTTKNEFHLSVSNKSEVKSNERIIEKFSDTYAAEGELALNSNFEPRVLDTLLEDDNEDVDDDDDVEDFVDFDIRSYGPYRSSFYAIVNNIDSYDQLVLIAGGSGFGYFLSALGLISKLFIV